MTRRLTIPPLADIDDASRAAALISAQEGVDVVFEFNGHEISVHPGDSAEKIANEWSRLQSAREQSKARPHPVPCACTYCCGWVERIAEEANPGMAVCAGPAIALARNNTNGEG